MNGNSAERTERTIMRIVSVRLAVGMLGERDNAGWWASGFMSPTSAAFLTPVFGAKILEARYEGILEAARRVHDERIGVGRVFHLFRLPEAMEQKLFDGVQSGSAELIKCSTSSEAAMAALEGLACKRAAAKIGPALVGTLAALDNGEWVAEVASLYAAAFSSGVKCFPYLIAA
jgi:hypothetical protein